MNRLLVPLLLLLTAAGIQAGAQPTNPTNIEPLSPPQQKAPVNNAQVADSERHAVTFEWARVDGAVAYGIEIDCFGCCEKHHWCSDDNLATQVEWMVSSPHYFSFPSARPGSWRVWAIDKAGHAGQVSDWSTFTLATAGAKNTPPRPPKKNTPPYPLPAPIVMRSDHPVDSATGEPCTWQAPRDATAPKGISTPEPEPTETARRFMINGHASVLLDLGADGLVQRACLLEAVQPDLGEQAVKAVRQWRFQPARKNGEPIPYAAVVEVSFYIYPWRMQ